ncbi:MAG TPA: lamin tail domain-containing protein, partial [Taishania sp.]|nr:lamin tail domain-containing protein [Taishania sp.]
MKTYLFLLQKSNYWILKLLVIASISINQSLHAQLIEDFSDNDFTNNPTWTGSTADFIVNTNQQLQLNANTGGQSYLVTPHLLDNLNEKVWQFWVRQNFAGSASNFGRIYLIAEQEDLSTNPDGIYIQLGEALATDAVRLMQQNSGTTTQICASADGTIAAAFQIGISVKRLTTGIWELSVDFNGSTNYSFVDSGIEIQIPTGDYFGYQCTYTAGNSTRFYLDNIYVGDEIIDTDPPILQTVVVIDNYNLDVLFSEEITSSSAENNANYELIPFNSIATATLDVTNQALVHLQLTSPLVNGNTYTLTTEAIEDLNGNSSSSQSINFVYLIAEQPTPGDVIINEFMADPSPVIGLPEVEFVEIYNRSSKIFNLAGWKLGDNTSFGTVATSNWLLPGEYRVLAPNTSVSLFTNAVGVTSFPSLNNASDDIKIADNNGNIIDALSYTTDWYHDASKANGGWTIERINPQIPCSDISNWKASIDSSGGTPGFQNTVFSLAPDSIVPIINQCMAVSSNTIRVVFNKPIDSLSIQNSIISINPSLTIIDREVETTFTTETFLTTQEPINYSTIYTIKITGFEDCSGQTGNDSTTFILPSIAAVGDILINEFMADPSPAVDLPEVEFVEIYNVSNKIIDLSNWKLGDNTTFGSFNGGIIYPNEYKVLTANSNVGQFTNSIGVTNFPSLNNTEDDIVIQNGQGTVIDKISYTTTWYQDNSKKDGGWSIERINPFAPCQSSNNWRASIDLTGGTPGFVNSVLDTFPDYSLPEIVSIEVITDQHIAIYFNKNIDSNALQNVQIFTNPSLTITYLFIPEKFTSYASIYFMEPLISSKIYTLTINGLTDCWGNENNVSENFILPSNPEVGEVIINEILFDQLTG